MIAISRDSQAGISIGLPELIQYHLLAKKINLTARYRADSILAGQYLSKQHGRGLDYAETRLYVPGDDIRTMDWRVLARSGKPHTKLYHQEKERPVYIVVDYSPSMFFASRVAFKSVMAARIAALLAWSASLQHDKVGGILFSGDQQIESRPQSGKRGVLPLLKYLSDRNKPFCGNTNNPGFFLALLRLRAVCKPGSLIFILSDFNEFDKNHKMHLSALTKNNQITAIRIRDILEIEPPPPGIYTISDGHSRQLSFSTNTKKQQTAYYDALHEHHHYVEKELTKLSIALADMLTHEDLHNDLFSRLLNRRFS